VIWGTAAQCSAGGGVSAPPQRGAMSPHAEATLNPSTLAGALGGEGWRPWEPERGLAVPKGKLLLTSATESVRRPTLSTGVLHFRRSLLYRSHVLRFDPHVILALLEFTICNTKGACKDVILSHG